MKINYDNQKLSEIIDSICNLTGLSMCIIDTDFNTLYTKEKKEDSFCHKIQNTPEGVEKCRCSDIKMIEECAKTKRPVSHICHAGLIDTVVPILKSNIIVGFIIIGRVRPTKDCENVRLKEDYLKLTYLSQKQLDALINLLSYILFENAIHIEYNDFIAKACEYIDNNLDKNLTVSILCKDLYVSKNYLYKSFRSFYGCTVNEYITDKKISKAKELLSTANENATDIAKSLGFDNYPYFYKLFKKKTGQKPSEYKKK